MSVGAMFLGGGHSTSRNGGRGGGGWMSSSWLQHMAAVVHSCRNPFVRTEWVISLLCTNRLSKHTFYLVVSRGVLLQSLRLTTFSPFQSLKSMHFLPCSPPEMKPLQILNLALFYLDTRAIHQGLGLYGLWRSNTADSQINTTS